MGWRDEVPSTDYVVFHDLDETTMKIDTRNPTRGKNTWDRAYWDFPVSEVKSVSADNRGKKMLRVTAMGLLHKIMELPDFALISITRAGTGTQCVYSVRLISDKVSF